MIRSRLVTPYTVDGRATFPDRQRPGVYLIFRRGALVYVGYSSVDVYKAMYRHFQTWTDESRERPRAVYPKVGSSQVRVIYTNGSAQAARLERALIVRYRPKDNPDKLAAHELEPADRAVLEAAADADFMDPGPAPF